jgi:hypothetical protein
VSHPGLISDLFNSIDPIRTRGRSGLQILCRRIVAGVDRGGKECLLVICSELADVRVITVCASSARDPFTAMFLLYG